MTILNARNVALNTRLTNGSECLTVNDDALNTKLRRDGGSKRLNVNDGSKRLNVNDGSKCLNVYDGSERLIANNGL